MLSTIGEKLEESCAVDVRELNAWFGENHVLRGVSLQVPKNSVFTIMGPSGSGKSTLLRAMNRLLELYPEARWSGDILLEGRSVFSMDPILVRRLFGMVFQIPNPIPNMSIYENVALGPKLNKLVNSREKLDELVRWALEKAQLWDEVKDRLKMPAGKLSGGQQQRLCLARALALRPKVLLMDEPTANLDPVNARKIEELMVELKREMTIILVTHYPPQAARVSDYIAFLYDGVIVEVGPAAQVMTAPRHELTERYITGRV